MPSHLTSSSSSLEYHHPQMTAPSSSITRGIDIQVLIFLTRCTTIIFITINVLFIMYMLNMNNNDILLESSTDNGQMSESLLPLHILFASNSNSNPNRILTTQEDDHYAKQRRVGWTSFSSLSSSTQVSSPIIFLHTTTTNTNTEANHRHPAVTTKANVSSHQRHHVRKSRRQQRRLV
jgi:hypothetical protein